MTVTIRMKTVAAAQAAALRPGVERLADHTVQGRIDRQCDVVVKWILGTRLNMPEARGTRRARSVSAARRCDARTGLRPSQGAA
ncbi:MAG: hypothetical protein JXA74_12215 [Anaerolineae bacterium]|nr:hypothetical protein [Anaerolineae bacterium]